VYSPSTFPFGEEDFRKWAFEELRKVETALSLFDFAVLKEQHNEPSRPRDGMVVYADGSDWDPGEGEGIYARINAAWVQTTNVPILGQCPVGTVLDYAGTSAPTYWLLCYGQEVSQATYAALYAIVGTTFNTGGEGAGNFRLPDLRGRVVAGQDDMGGSSADRLTGVTGSVNGDTFGATGGAETHVLTTAQLAAHTHTANVTDTHTHGLPASIAGTAFSGSTAFFTNANGATLINANVTQTSTVASGGAGSISVTNVNAGSDAAHNNVQPTIILNKIIYAGV
jgi:microcystin-dependent protein